MKLKRILSIVFVLSFMFNFSFGCDYRSDSEKIADKINEIKLTFEEDEHFNYAFDYVTNSYHICGVKGALPTTYYIPLEFNGKKISDISHTVFNGDFHTNGGIYQFLPNFSSIENLYLTDSIEFIQDGYLMPGPAQNIYLAQNITEKWGYDRITQLYVSNNEFINQQFIYMTSNTFAIVSERFSNFLIKSDYKVVVEKKNGTKTIQMANVVFYYNNETAENNTFIVDNKDGAYLINKPPYDPVLEGCIFAGWYKEPECVNAWDFDNDLTPELEYNEQGELIFKETSLYAKWL